MNSSCLEKTDISQNIINDQYDLPVNMHIIFLQHTIRAEVKGLDAGWDFSQR